MSNKSQSKNGNKTTFIVQVMHHQNATWQGKVKWVETGKEKMFRSTLELLKLMDEAISEGAEIITQNELE
ncbi:MAG: hypothetical protein ACRC7V_01905 [Lachnospiraceae bacterium]